MKKNILFLLTAIVVASCTTPKTLGEQYPAMYEEKPVTIAIMPPINQTTHAEAKDYFYTTMYLPLCEKGYYVYSPYLTMEMFQQESAYDAELFVNVPLTTFRNYFGCDAVVFSEITNWAKSGFTINANIRYFIKSASTGEILFDRSCDLILDLSIDSGNNSAIAALIELAASAINTAMTDHIVAARKANYYIFRDIPRGKYSPMYGQDQNVAAEPQNVHARVQ